MMKRLTNIETCWCVKACSHCVTQYLLRLESLITLLQQEIANRTRKTLDIHLDDVQAVCTASCMTMPSETNALSYYSLILQGLAQGLQPSLSCDSQYAKDARFLKNLLDNTKRYQSHFASQADKFLDVSSPNSIRPTIPILPDTFDVLMNQASMAAVLCKT